jgi:hypothetical protein
MFAKAMPAIEADAKAGHPYIPSAGKPEELPQADIPAFPGPRAAGCIRSAVAAGASSSSPVWTTPAGDIPRSLRNGRTTNRRLQCRWHHSSQGQDSRPRAYITIAGNTAPGDGVCIAGNTVELEKHDMIVRHMRLRRGSMDVTDRNDSGATRRQR